MERNFKGIWIPKEVYLNKELSWIEKILFVTIKNSDLQISNADKLAEKMNLSIPHTKALLNSLIKKKFIKSINLDSKNVKEIVINSKNCYGEQCEWCGEVSVALQEHHFPIAKADGGTETVKICPNCHYEYHYYKKELYEIEE